MIGTTPSWIVGGGWVRSRNDGQRHYVTGAQVARLHGLDRRDCLRYVPGAQYPPGSRYLFPRLDGEYARLPPRPPAPADAPPPG